MKMGAIMRLWRNAIEIQLGVRRGASKEDARAVVIAIRQEWDRRRLHGHVADEVFNWPDTDAPIGSGKLSTDGWLQEGLMRYMGYQVSSEAGISEITRRRILEEVFEGALPPVFQPSYLEKWGPPESPMRLQQMAETIAAFARNGKRRKIPGMDAPIKAWERDLGFLYDQFYVGKFRFAWPSSSNK